MSLRCYNMLNLAGDAAINGKTKAQMVYTHGAVICKNNKKVCEGYNHKRSYSDGKLCCSFHAEFDAVRKWKSIFLRGKKQWCLLRHSAISEEV